MRRLFLVLAAVAAIGISPAFAGTAFSPYDKTKLDAFIKSGAPVVVHVHAEWCPVCRRQVMVLDELFNDPALAKIEVVRVNYDKDRDFVSGYKVKRQANILVFKGGKEVSRIDYDADVARIRAAVGRAL